MDEKKIGILHLGIKNYPFNSGMGKPILKGLRGGGMNKYCSTLINSLPNSIETVIITQKLQGQKEFEIVNKAYVYRYKTFGSRAVRQIILNILSFFVSHKLIKKHKIVIIHGHMQIGIFFSYLISRFHNIKSIGTPYSFATDNDHFKFSKIAKFIEENFYKRLDKLIFETEENKIKAKELRNLSFTNSDVINTGVDIPLKQFQIKKQQKILNVYYIGRIVKIKALDKLIKSFNHLNLISREKIRLHIAGEGEMFHEYQKLIVENKLSKFIKMYGFVEDTRPFYEDFDIFILPSDMEGLSISLLESMAYGKACIVNNFGVPFSEQEVFIMENNNPKTIANSINYFLENKNLIRNLGLNARSRIISDFSVKSFSEKYVDTYKKLSIIKS